MKGPGLISLEIGVDQNKKSSMAPHFLRGPIGFSLLSLYLNRALFIMQVEITRSSFSKKMSALVYQRAQAIYTTQTVKTKNVIY